MLKKWEKFIEQGKNICENDYFIFVELFCVYMFFFDLFSHSFVDTTLELY